MAVLRIRRQTAHWLEYRRLRPLLNKHQTFCWNGLWSHVFQQTGSRRKRAAWEGPGHELSVETRCSIFWKIALNFYECFQRWLLLSCRLLLGWKLRKRRSLYHRQKPQNFQCRRENAGLYKLRKRFDKTKEGARHPNSDGVRFYISKCQRGVQVNWENNIVYQQKQQAKYEVGYEHARGIYRCA